MQSMYYSSLHLQMKTKEYFFEFKSGDNAATVFHPLFTNDRRILLDVANVVIWADKNRPGPFKMRVTVFQRDSQ